MKSARELHDEAARAGRAHDELRRIAEHAIGELGDPPPGLVMVSVGRRLPSGEVICDVVSVAGPAVDPEMILRTRLQTEEHLLGVRHRLGS